MNRVPQSIFYGLSHGRGAFVCAPSTIMRRAAFAHLIFACLLLTACQWFSRMQHTPLPSARSTPSATWTILVFMNGKNNLEPFALSNFLAMARAPGNRRVNVIAELGRLGMDDYKNPVWQGTYLFRIRHGTKPIPQWPYVLRGKDVPKPDVDMGSASSVAQFVNFGMQHYPAQHYMLIMWDHGQGWRLMVAQRSGEEFTAPIKPLNNATPLPYANARLALGEIPARILSSAEKGVSAARVSSEVSNAVTIASATMPPADPNNVVAPPVKSISDDLKTQHSIYNRDLEDALKGSLDGKKLDVLGFDACLMGMAEVDYAFRDVARYVTASEDAEEETGWDYKTIITYLDNHPAIDPQTLATEIVFSYTGVAVEAGPHGIPTSTGTLSAFNLAAVPALADAIDGLSMALMKNLRTQAPYVRHVRSTLLTYGRGLNAFPYVDLREFAERLSHVSPNANVKNAATKVSQTISTAVVANYASANRTANYGSYGVAIYFPPTYELFKLEPAYIPDEVVTAPVEFVQQHSWSRFLDAYLRFSLIPN